VQARSGETIATGCGDPSDAALSYASHPTNGTYQRNRIGLGLANPLLPVLRHCIELATGEKTLFAFDPIRRMVPTTMTRITASSF